MTKQRSKFNQLAISVIMSAIVIAFVFTGVQSFTNNPNTLGDVDGTEISVTEYNRALNRMLDYYTQINQGKSLTQKEIRDRGIKEQVFQQLVSQKMMLNFAKSMKFDGGKEAVKNTITTQYPDFMTNKQFDVTKYKRILKLNGISFKKFESDVVEQVKMNKLNTLLEAQSFSDKYTNDLLRFKNSTADVYAASFAKEDMTVYLDVSKDEINKFLGESKSKAIIDSLYQTYQAKEGKKAKKLDQVKNDLAKKHLQRTKRSDLKKFNEKLKTDLEAAFKGNNWKKVASLAKKYNLKYEKKTEMTLLNLTLPGMNLEEDKVRNLFGAKNTTDVLVNDSPLSISLLKAVSFKQAQTKEKEKEQFLTFSKNSAGRALNFKVLEYQKKKSKVNQYMQL